jgi:hypothetical protein
MKKWAHAVLVLDRLLPTTAERSVPVLGLQRCPAAAELATILNAAQAADAMPDS